ncbi:hypothetical protein [Streptacidiphilus monticola]|uniref:Prepilin peptidase n=1 Tax=Streptacidiphilus monticola TaxID=2161674 RepID=A0ABW1G783_9ACTN
MTLVLLLASGAALIAGARYAWLCWAHPFAPCRRCAGLGRTLTRVLRRSVNCPRCHGTGQRVRIGRRIHTHSVRLHQRGTR